MANPKFLSMRNELADNRFLGSYSRSVEEIIFLMGVVILSPIWVVMLHAVFGRYRLSRLGVFFLAISFSLFFLNRSFGIPLGGGAFDDVPQYVYLFLNIERYGLVEGNGIWTFEPGFIALTWLLALISDSSLFYLFMVFFISTFALINGINRLANFRVSVAIVAFFVIFGVVFYGYMHLLRQTLALSFLVWGCSYYIEESKGAITKGWVLFLLSGLLHVAAIPVFIGVVLTRRFWTRSKILLSLGLIIALPLAVFAS
ncbi:MAG: EpsG family protein, partial [Spongiibacter marinus]|uniref:EpsG family protein n=1 Tax=Spongiibacter marinus TaxID=354246 RepID=UPI003C49F894